MLQHAAESTSKRVNESTKLVMLKAGYASLVNWSTGQLASPLKIPQILLRVRRVLYAQLIAILPLLKMFQAYFDAKFSGRIEIEIAGVVLRHVALSRDRSPLDGF